MKRKKESKKAYARRRALQRYGINYGSQTRSDLVRIIQNNQATFLESVSNKEKNFAVFYEGQWYAITYNNRTKEIVNFLPSRYLMRYRHILSPN